MVRSLLTALVVCAVLSSVCTLALPKLPDEWHVIAPFPVGTREIGVDTLEAFGGIFKIPIGGAAKYPSDLYAGGEVGWRNVDSINGAVTVEFNASEVDFDLINAWSPAATSWQGWAVADFEVTEPGTFFISCDHVSSQYFIDDKVFKGDYYAASLAIHPVTLSAGTHRFYVHLLNQGFSCTFSEPTSESDIGPTNPGEHWPTMFPDIVVKNDTDVQILASPYFALSITNKKPTNFLTDVTVSIDDPHFKISKQYKPSLAPEQTRPIRFELELVKNVKCGNVTSRQKNYLGYAFDVVISANDTTSIKETVVVHCKNWPEDPYKFTYPDYDDTIAYAMLRAPAKDCKTAPGGSCPILFTFHGAEVVSNADGWTKSYSQQDSYWILFPTNRRNYGWDFQGPGRLNALTSFEYFTANLPGIPATEKDRVRPDANRIVYAGHSMGGHGCWAISTKHPDKALAVAPAAGWISFPMYIPFFTRVGNSFVSPYLQQIFQASISMDKTDFYARNLQGLPLITRFGGKDTNVPPYHMRRMSRLVDQINGNKSWVEISEVPGQPHWFSGVVDGPVMQTFFDDHLKAKLPTLPRTFTVTTMHTGSSSGRGGIKIVQQHLNFRASFVKVTRNLHWELSTQNVRRLGFNAIPTLDFPTQGIVLDGQTFNGAPSLYPDVHFCNLDGKEWKICKGTAWTQAERSPATSGPLVQVIERPFYMVVGTKGTKEETAEYIKWATLLANSWNYQIRSMVDIVLDTDLPADHKTKNLILLGGPSTNSLSKLLADADTLPITFTGNTFAIDARWFSDPGTGVAFLAPWGTSSLACVLTGTDMDGFRKTAYAFPKKSGHMVPDYIVLGPEWGWAGDGGVLAAGFWSNQWAYQSETGYVQYF